MHRIRELPSLAVPRFVATTRIYIIRNEPRFKSVNPANTHTQRGIGKKTRMVMEKHALPTEYGFVNILQYELFLYPAVVTLYDILFSTFTRRQRDIHTHTHTHRN